MSILEKAKNLIRGFGSVGLGMLAGVGVLGLVGGDSIFGILAIVIGIGGIVVINGVVETPLDMS